MNLVKPKYPTLDILHFLLSLALYLDLSFRLSLSDRGPFGGRTFNILVAFRGLGAVQSNSRPESSYSVQLRLGAETPFPRSRTQSSQRLSIATLSPKSVAKSKAPKPRPAETLGSTGHRAGRS